MALITRYVNPDSTAGGDGTTNATTGANRAYVSLSAWDAAQQQDLDTGNNIAECICETGGSADTTSVDLDGWTTSATDYIDIKTSSGHRHAGVWSTAKYRLHVTQDFQQAFNVNEDFVRVTGLQIKTQGAPSSCEQAVSVNNTAVAASSSIIFDACLVQATGAHAANGIGFLCGSGTTTIRNCIIFGCDDVGVYCTFQASAATVNVDNCTVAGIGTNAFFRDAGTLTVRNSYAHATTADYSGTMTLTTCAHASASVFTGSTASIAHSTANFTNVTATTENYHLDPGASATLISGGTDLSGTFTLDVDGGTRAAPFSIGADQPPTVILDQEGFIFRLDDGSETTATGAGSQDANVTHPLNTNLRPRVLVNATEDPSTGAYTLRYKKSTDSVYLASPTAQPSCTATVHTSGASTSNAATYDTASVALTAGKLYVIGVTHSDTAAEQEATGIATVGGAEAFTMLTSGSQIFDTLASNAHRLSVWSCVPSATVTAAVRITLNDAGTGCAWVLLEVNDSIITGTDGANAFGTVNKSGVDANTQVSATPAALTNSRSLQIAFAAADNNLDDTPSGTGWSALADETYASPSTSLECAHNTSGTAATVTFSGGGSADRACIAVEIKAFTHPIIISASANITGGGEATTALLAAPAGKTTSDFVTGRMWDDENGSDSTDITANDYSEFEWCVQAVSPAVNGDIYQLRVYKGTTALSTYSLTPEWTIGTPAQDAPELRGRPFGNRGHRQMTQLLSY